MPQYNPIMPRVLVPFAGVAATARGAGRWLGAALSLVLAAACGDSEPPPQNQWLGKYDFVFVSIDTLRADHLGSYGYLRQTDGDPADPLSLAWLAANGRKYQQCWAPIGKTMPSLASFWTGLFPLEHGAISNPTLLAQDVLHFAEEFQANQYQTHAMVANRALPPGLGLDQGFDSYGIRAKLNEGNLGPDLLKQAEQAIAQSKPLMVWAHWMSPHQPYTPPAAVAQTFTQRTEPVADNNLLYGYHRNPDLLSEEDKQYIIDLYDAEILLASQRLQQFLQGLDQRYRAAGRGGLTDNAVIVFFSDHGEELADRNGYFMHAKSLYSGVLQVPLLILAPELNAETITQPIALQDVMPLVMKGVEPSATSFAASWQTGFYAWRKHQWTLIQNPGNYAMGPLEPPDDVAYVYPYVALYDRSTDPLEQHNVAAKYPEITRQLLSEQHLWFQTMNRRDAIHVNGNEDQNRLQALVDLGYIVDVPDTFVVPLEAEEWQQ